MGKCGQVDPFKHWDPLDQPIFYMIIFGYQDNATPSDKDNELIEML